MCDVQGMLKGAAARAVDSATVAVFNSTFRNFRTCAVSVGGDSFMLPPLKCSLFSHLSSMLCACRLPER